jgi:hypothetical protein
MTHMHPYDVAVSPRPPKKNRVIRVDDATWEAAMARAEAEGLLVSEEVRKFLERFGKGYRKGSR